MRKKIVISLSVILGITVGGLLISDNQKNISASKVNDYIHSKNIQSSGISFPIWSGFPTDDMGYRKGKNHPEGVVVHETANPNSTINNEIAYMKSNYENAFVHTFVDNSHIINIADTNNMSWGSGPKGNARFVQFEQVEVKSKDAFAREIKNAAYYTAYVLNHYKLKPVLATGGNRGNGATVWSHGDVTRYLGGTDHTDPDGYYASAGKKWFGQAYTMTDLFKLVQEEYNKMQV
ncbi:peptidoglycan recognition protein family protein, partial [Dellaglioa carnosa]